ncbi:hypothetical protein [Oscillatoria salina]|nr:hypothetical protein [Oscillatoria salina]MBZ8180189.1 hypothetical protein [Oscillatoria salina IIICB1]
MEANTLSQTSKNQQKINEQQDFNFEEWAKAVRPQLLAALRKRSASSS